MASPASLPVLSVSQFLDISNEVLATTESIVEGEVTSVKVYPKAVYFSLTDSHDKAILSCTAWRSRLESHGMTLTDGIAVRVWGVPEIYKPSGRFSFMVRSISPVGEGALRQAFEQLKKQLQAAGYFDPDRKKPITKYPTKIGLITSARGAAINDFLTHLGHHGFEIQHLDTLVQGPQAVGSLVQAIEYFNQQAQPVDVVVITRGGGSLEDLQAFNAEQLAKAIFASKIPIISAVGHEDDVSICDLVADERASTPTAAAKRLSQHWLLAEQQVPRTAENIMNAASRQFQIAHHQLNRYAEQLPAHFSQMLKQEFQMVDSLRQDLQRHSAALLDRLHRSLEAFSLNLTLWQHRAKQVAVLLTEQATELHARFQRHLLNQQLLLKHQQEKLQLADPQLKLKQGYAIVRNQAGQVVKSTTQLAIHDQLALQLGQGQAITKVEEITS